MFESLLIPRYMGWTDKWDELSFDSEQRNVNIFVRKYIL